MNRVAPGNFPTYGTFRPSNWKAEAATTKGCPISRPMALVLTVSAIAGSAPVTVTNGCMMLSRRRHSYCCVVTCLLGIVGITGNVLDVISGGKYSVRTTNPTTTLVWTCDVAFLNLAALLCVSTGPKRMKRAMEVLSSLAKLNVKHNKSRQMRSAKRRFILVLIVFTYTIVLLIYDYASMLAHAFIDHKNWHVVMYYGALYFQYFNLALFEMQFMMVALPVTDSLRALNDMLEKNLNKVKNSSQKSPSSYNISLSIRRLATAHGTLSDLVQELNRENGPFLLLMVCCFIQHLVTSLYYMVFNIFNRRPAYTLLLDVMWCTFHTVNMFAIIEPCYITDDELKRTKALLGKLYGHVTTISEPLSQQVEMFCWRLSQKNVGYSSMGICTMNRPLIAQILGGVSTYLVIILQFQRM